MLCILNTEFNQTSTTLLIILDYSEIIKTLGYRRVSLKHLPILNKPKGSRNSFKTIRSYAVNTSKGVIRDYNQDRVAIVLNMVCPKGKDPVSWPNCSFFGVKNP